jgi:hypothetical protein
MRRMISMIEMSLFEARRCCIYSASYLGFITGLLYLLEAGTDRTRPSLYSGGSTGCVTCN